MQRYCVFLFEVYVKEVRDAGDLHVKSGLLTELNPTNALSFEKCPPQKRPLGWKLTANNLEKTTQHRGLATELQETSSNPEAVTISKSSRVQTASPPGCDGLDFSWTEVSGEDGCYVRI